MVNRSHWKRLAGAFALSTIALTAVGFTATAASAATGENNSLTLTATPSADSFRSGDIIGYGLNFSNDNYTEGLRLVSITVPSGFDLETCNLPFTSSVNSAGELRIGLTGELALGQSFTCAVSYASTAADAEAGKITSTFFGLAKGVAQGVKDPLPQRAITEVIFDSSTPEPETVEVTPEAPVVIPATSPGGVPTIALPPAGICSSGFGESDQL